MTDKVIIYTDGSSLGNPGPGGWAAIFIFSDGKTFEMGGQVSHTTNNQMELTAPIQALKYLEDNKIKGPVEIFSDSKYVILGITEWINNWMKNNWRNATKKPVLNSELWKKLYDLAQELKPKWNYVEGHTGEKWNERADEIATSFAGGEPVKLISLK